MAFIALSNNIAMGYVYIETCSDKKDHLGFFINIECLVWMDSPFCVEYNGESFKRKYLPQVDRVMMSYTYLGSLFPFPENRQYTLVISQELITPHNYNSVQQMYSLSIAK